MKQYIEREAAIKICPNQYKECLRKSDWCGDTVAWNIGFGIKAIPAADVVEVVRCKDCKHITPVEGGLPLCTRHNTACAYNDFCSYGERRADNCGADMREVREDG